MHAKKQKANKQILSVHNKTLLQVVPEELRHTTLLKLALRDLSRHVCHCPGAQVLLQCEVIAIVDH